MERNEIEKLIAENPDYVRDAILYWWETVPEEERDKVASANVSGPTYTSRQIFGEAMNPLSSKLTPNERKEAFRKMPDIPKDQLGIILKSYREK